MAGLTHGDPWDPRQYGLFGDERSRPFFELVNRVGATEPRLVVDLGCGSGGLTAALARRWPGAAVEGIDGSPEMIAAAQEHVAPGLRFTVGDLADWAPAAGRPADVIVSNAALQWVPAHRDLLTRWINALPAGGWLAFQVPGNFDAPSHVILRELCRAPRWRDRLAGVAPGHPVGTPGEYLDLLTGHGCRVDAWETTYIQVLRGEDPVLEWVKGTALRPVLGALEAADAADLTGEYASLLREAYPRRPHGTIFPFRRVFVVARRGPA